MFKQCQREIVCIALCQQTCLSYSYVVNGVMTNPFGGQVPTAWITLIVCLLVHRAHHLRCLLANMIMTLLLSAVSLYVWNKWVFNCERVLF